MRVLSTYLGLLKTINNNNEVTKFPFVIDSPFQQEPDIKNKQLIFKTLFEEMPNIVDQIIVATVELPDESTGYLDNPNVEVIELKDKQSLLKEEEFNNISKEFEYLFNQKNNLTSLSDLN